MKGILFLCTGNSCRSQMGEGLLRALKGDQFQAFSAGTKKHGLNPNAVKVMAEIGIDITSHASNTVEEIDLALVNTVITVCSDAHENCPYIPGKKIIHKGFDDPPRLTKDMTDEDQILDEYRRVRDEIKTFVENIESYL